MKTIRPIGPVTALIFGALGVGITVASATGADTHAANELKFPQSVFTMPTRPEEGRDPFFPKSQRPYARATTAATTNAAPVTRALLLELKGLMGPPTRRLATINNQTFAVGDEAEVSTTAGRLLVRCLEIRNRSVVVEAGTPPQRMELFLRERF